MSETSIQPMGRLNLSTLTTFDTDVVIFDNRTGKIVSLGDALWPYSGRRSWGLEEAPWRVLETADKALAQDALLLDSWGCKDYPGDRLWRIIKAEMNSRRMS